MENNNKNNHIFETTKVMNLVVDQNFTYTVIDVPTVYSSEYVVYNVMCFFDHKNPIEFINLLLEKSCQWVVPKLTVVQSYDKQTFSINNGQIAVCRIDVTKRHIVFETPNSYDVLNLTFGNTINTFGILKYLLKTMNLEKTLDAIRKYTCEKFTVTNIIYINIDWTSTFNNFRNLDNDFIVCIHNNKLNMNFDVSMNVVKKTITFGNYMTEEIEYAESAALTTYDIDRKIEFYTQLKYSVAEIESYLLKLQELL